MSHVSHGRELMDASPLYLQIDVPVTMINVIGAVLLAAIVLVTISYVCHGNLMSLAYGYGAMTAVEAMWIGAMMAVFRKRH